MGNIGTGELIIALLVVVMLFGARRLPEVARGLGQFLKIFKSEPLWRLFVAEGGSVTRRGSAVRRL
jgi:TatA/E family protein of Tat protein translocase